MSPTTVLLVIVQCSSSSPGHLAWLQERAIFLGLLVRMIMICIYKDVKPSPCAADRKKAAPIHLKERRTAQLSKPLGVRNGDCKKSTFSSLRKRPYPSIQKISLCRLDLPESTRCLSKQGIFSLQDAGDNHQFPLPGSSHRDR